MLKLVYGGRVLGFFFEGNALKLFCVKVLELGAKATEHFKSENFAK